MVFHNFSLCVHHLFFHCFPPCSPMFPYMSITFSIVFHHVSLSFPICPSFFPWFSTMFPYVSLYFHHFFHGFPPCFAIFPLFPMVFHVAHAGPSVQLQGPQHLARLAAVVRVDLPRDAPRAEALLPGDISGAKWGGKFGCGVLTAFFGGFNGVLIGLNGGLMVF
jgi:hypothetical protein